MMIHNYSLIDITNLKYYIYLLSMINQNYQSCRRITTEQSDKIIKKPINNQNAHNKIIIYSSKNNSKNNIK